MCDKQMLLIISSKLWVWWPCMNTCIYKTTLHKLNIACCVGSFRISFVWWQLTVFNKYHFNQSQSKFFPQYIMKREITLICKKHKYRNFHAKLQISKYTLLLHSIGEISIQIKYAVEGYFCQLYISHIPCRQPLGI